MWTPLGPIESVLVREVLISGVNAYTVLGPNEVSTKRCPDFRVSTFKGSTVHSNNIMLTLSGDSSCLLN